MALFMATALSGFLGVFAFLFGGTFSPDLSIFIASNQTQNFKACQENAYFSPKVGRQQEELRELFFLKVGNSPLIFINLGRSGEDKS